MTLAAVADEIAAAADLVKGKTTGIPVAIVRGLGLVTESDGPGAQALIRPAAEDMFRYGSAEVLTARRTVREFTTAPVDSAAVRRAIEATGAELRLLPPYSPDFNPIENAFAKLKALLRKAAARTVASLERAIAEAIDTFTPAECANYFAAAGYDAT